MANLNFGANMKSLKILALAAVGAAGALGACRPEPAPQPKPPVAATVKSFTASAAIVGVGESVTLSWQVEDAESVAIATSFGRSVPLPDAAAASGTVAVTLEEDTIFVLTARGDGGSDSRPVAVAVTEAPDELLFTAFPQRISAGEPVALVWNAPGAGPITVRDGAGAEVLATEQGFGTHVVHPRASTTYTLTAGSLSAAVEVAVGPAVFAFAAAAPSAQPGGTVTLMWRVGGAAEVEVSGEGRGVLHTETDPGRIADGTFEESVPAGLADRNGVLRYVLTARAGQEQVVRGVSVYVGVDPKVTSFTVPPYGKAGATFPVRWTTLEADEVEIAIDGTAVYVAQSAAEVASGEYHLATPLADAQVTLTARNARGGTAALTLPHSPVGVTTLQSFTITPALVGSAGDAATLDWNVPNARRLRIYVPGKRLVLERSGLAAETGSVAVYPNDPTEYVLEADNTIGDAVGPVAVTGEATTRSRLRFSPGSMPYGATQALSGATVVTGDLVARNFAVKNAAGEAFEDIAATGAALDLPVMTATSPILTLVDLGEVFEIPIHGKTFSTDVVAVSTRGWLSFDPAAPNITAIPNAWVATTMPLPPFAIAPYLETQLADADSKVLWELRGAGPDRRLIVQWENMRYSTTLAKRLNYQVQLFASGKVVFAYKSFVGLVAADVPSIGIADMDGREVIAPMSRQMTGNRPADGDTFTFFSTLALPLEVGAFPDRYEVDVVLSGGASVPVAGTPGVILPGDFWISEANPFPGTAASDGEWIEITNATNNTFDLSGWELDFGAAGKHVLSPTAPLELPPQGVLLLAASGDPAQNGGIAPDHVYGTGFPMADAAGAVGIAAAGQPAYDTATWSAATGHAQGVSARFDPVLLGHRFLTGVTQSTCAGTGAYGTQTGSPGARVPGCFPYRVRGLAQGNFESIAATGTKINAATPTNEFLVTLDFPGLLPAPVRMGNDTYNRLYVGDNGFVALRDQAETALACVSATSCYNANKTSFSTANPRRVVAPFWDTLSGNQPTSGMYLQRKDPDATVAGDEYTIVSWEGWNWSTGTALTSIYNLNFQVKFFDDGNIEYHYGTMDPPSGATATQIAQAEGSSATIWLESHDMNVALLWHMTTSYGPGVHPGEGVRYQFVP